jgi:hypothetical protein
MNSEQKSIVHQPDELAAVQIEALDPVRDLVDLGIADQGLQQT